MKYNLKDIMKRAWELKRKNNKNIFAICLQMAWEEAKNEVIYMTTMDTYHAINEIRKTCEVVGEYDYDLDGERIQGECDTLVKNDPYMPICKVICSNGFFYCTDYKKSATRLPN